MGQPLDPHKTVLVVRTEAGTEVARMAATDPNAQQRLTVLAQTHGGIKVEYVEDAEEAKVQRIAGSIFGRLTPG